MTLALLYTSKEPPQTLVCEQGGSLFALYTGVNVINKEKTHCKSTCKLTPKEYVEGEMPPLLVYT